jgi:hypothetical protein
MMQHTHMYTYTYIDALPVEEAFGWYEGRGNILGGLSSSTPLLPRLLTVTPLRFYKIYKRSEKVIQKFNYFQYSNIQINQ